VESLPDPDSMDININRKTPPGFDSLKISNK